jgi:hypothetical protein
MGWLAGKEVRRGFYLFSGLGNFFYPRAFFFCRLISLQPPGIDSYLTGSCFVFRTARFWGEGFFFQGGSREDLILFTWKFLQDLEKGSAPGLSFFSDHFPPNTRISSRFAPFFSPMGF